MKAKTVYEAMTDVLKPKSGGEIQDITMDIMSRFDHYLSDHIDSDENEKIIIKLGKLMDSDPKDIVILAEDDDNYERIENILRMLVVKGGKPDYFHYEDNEFTYAVSKKNKIAFAGNVGMGVGLNALFFNKPFVLELLKEYYG